jgi:hypothetical protein
MGNFFQVMACWLNRPLVVSSALQALLAGWQALVVQLVPNVAPAPGC